MEWKTSIMKTGGSTYLLLPPALVEHLGLVEGPEQAILQDKEKSRGRFAAFWAVKATKR